MIICLITIFIYLKSFQTEDFKSSFVFWGETIALIAYGISCLTNGGTFFPINLFQFQK